MKILMFGWEYPPVKSGGLGTACYGMTKAMAKFGADITLVVPCAIKSEFSSHLNLVDSQKIKIKKDKVKYYEINSLLAPYLNEHSYEEKFYDYQKLFKEGDNENISYHLYGRNLFHEVSNFAKRAKIVASLDDYDIIVCHDWMTVEAAFLAKEVLNKPVCLHIHATEFDRTGGHPHQLIYDIEKEGMEKADFIIANSFITKETCVKNYGIPPEKIIPIHLGIDKENYQRKTELLTDKTDKKVLFIGRLTIQKGPEYFIRAAKIALDFNPNIKFIMAGSGDYFSQALHLASDLGISDKLFFTGFLNEEEAKQVFKMADLFVMTSIAEPFGLTVLEAIRSGVPCVIPKNSGIAEILSHVIKIDFWDVNELANNIVSILKYPALHQELQNNSYRETEHVTWENVSRKMIDVYQQLIQRKVVQNA